MLRVQWSSWDITGTGFVWAGMVTIVISTTAGMLSKKRDAHYNGDEMGGMTLGVELWMSASKTTKKQLD